MSKKSKNAKIDEEILKGADEAAEAAAEAAAKAAAELEEEAEKAETSKPEKAAKKDKSDKDPRDEKIKELEDKVVRQMAEFDNFRKRTDKEKSEMFDIGMKNMIEKILPIVDNFERGLAATTESPEAKAFVDGMNMVYKQLMKTLEDAGVKPIEAVGAEFDPNIHNAVLHEEDDSDKENIVIEELQKGYKYKDSLVRPSMVKVLN